MIEDQTYNNERDFENSMKRGADRPNRGWRPLSHKRATLTVTWSNDPEPRTPRRQQTQRQFIDELANERHTDIV